MKDQATISDCPASGAGVHLWIFKAAHELRDQDVPADEAVRIITELMPRAPGPTDEVETAVAKVFSGVVTPKSPRWSRVNPELRASIISAGPRLADLDDASPIRVDPPGCAAALLARLFAPDDLICCGWEKNRFDTRPLSAWTGLDRMRYVVPSPMRALRGKTQRGQLSAKSNDNAGPRKFLVVEFDTGELDEHAAFAWQLGKFAPLVMCVFSGGKSLHSWFNVARWTDADAEKFFNYAVTLGADRALWCPSQFTRMPEGTHADGGRQAVHYFDPSKL